MSLLHLIVAVGCAFGVVVNLRDISRIPRGVPAKFWKTLNWANAVLFGLGGVINAYWAGQ